MKFTAVSGAFNNEIKTILEMADMQININSRALEKRSVTTELEMDDKISESQYAMTITTVGCLYGMAGFRVTAALKIHNTDTRKFYITISGEEI